MKLLSARVENYRLHKSIVVDFKDNPTLIGGANETGKSTFIEAIHRAFFLRHNAGGAIHAGMVSTTHGGTPMVEVTFEAGGREYRLVKEFNGPRGTATLTPADGRALSGDEAEEALAKLLSTEGAVSGGGAQNKLATQWAHLWIWQGRSGEDPAGQVRPVSGDLIQRLQESGGAVAQQSALDAEVAARVADLYSSGHTKSGSPRTGSPLDVAAKALEAAANEVETARNRVEATRADAGKVVRSREAIVQHTDALAEVRQSLKDVEDRQRALEKLRTAVEAAERDLNIATEERDRRRRTEKDFKDKHAALERLRKRLEPAAAKLEQAKQALRTAQADRKEAKAALDKATGAVESARRKRDLAESYRRQLRSREELAAREETLKAIRQTRKEITSIEKQRAKLPELETRDLAELRKLEQSLAHAESTLAAIATDVERVKGTGKVTLGGEELAPGKPRQIDVPSELAVGRDIVVRISPGGGKNLEEAREALAAAQRKRQEKLEAHGLASVEAAAEALASRERLTADLKAAANRLEALAPEATAKARESLSREFDTASARVESLLQQVDDLPAPEDGTAAEDLLTACEQDLASMQNELGGKRSAVAAMGDKAEKLEADLASATEAHRQITAEISHTQSGLAVLVEQYGEDRKRADDLARAEEAFKAASEKLDNLKAQRDALKPDQLEADSQRLTRSIEKTSAALQDARDELAGAEARLQSDGLEDPEELLALAEARLAAAEEAHAREARIDKATTLLHTSFKKEQQALSEQFSQPLADRINTYLQAVFGPGARAKVGLEEKQLGTIELIRDARTGAFAFDTLSGGTREQVAAAARLAIAELLAAGFDGTLPVVFDDAFTHSDPARVRELQRMLDLAVQRGLQLILLTCNPADYTTLGASVVELG